MSKLKTNQRVAVVPPRLMFVCMCKISRSRRLILLLARTLLLAGTGVPRVAANWLSDWRGVKCKDQFPLYQDWYIKSI
jgi:hypothetical protein